MRELGFSEKWPKLKQDTFTTFRFQRRDKDWQVGEVVRVVFKPRTKGREVLGVAKIISKEPRRIDRFRGVPTIPHPGFITEAETGKDGFANGKEMLSWLDKSYHRDSRWQSGKPMNKLTLEWVKPKRVVYLLDGKPQIAEVGGHPWGYEGDIARDEGGHERLEVIEVLEWEKDDRRSR